MDKTTKDISGPQGDTTPRGARRQAGPANASAARPHVVIAGAGMVGLSLALALHQASGGIFRVWLVDPGFGKPPRTDGRASAIAAGARRMLSELGAWPEAADTQAITEMIVTDSQLDDGVRPTLLTFAGEASEGEPFAHMVENAVLAARLTAALTATDVLQQSGSIASLERHPSHVEVRLDDGERLAADVVLACDGARSRLRTEAGIRMVGWDYDQSAIVTTLLHDEPHHGRAEEHFLPAGPFAILPLNDDAQGCHRSSLVWTEKSREATRLMALDDDGFHEALLQRFGHHLGRVSAGAQRFSYPLAMKVARRFVADRLALVGDAAHIIHPIAGQGLNLGFRDAAALTQVMVEAFRLGEDFGSLAILGRYERWRRFDTLAMGFATDGLNRLFSNDIGVIRGFRGLGLGIVDRLPRLKSVFIGNASGLVGDVPRLLQGQAI